MKRVLIGTFSCVVNVISPLALASRWPALFWRLVLGVGLYFLFGRKVEVELRLGVKGGEERRVYGALVWKRRAGAVESVVAQELAKLQVSPTGRDG